MTKPMHVVVACDDNYFSYAYVCAKTLFEHAADEDSIVLHYIEQNVSQSHLKAIKSLGNDLNYIVDIIKFEMPDRFKNVLPTYGEASKTTYMKFWFATMFPEIDKVLYLDPDIIVMKSIRELYDYDLGNSLIAAVIENLPVYHRYASKMDKEDSYINGGMVLCNLREWRESDFEIKAMERLKDTKHNLNYDQGILNELCKGRILIVPPKYAVLAEVFAFMDANRIMQRYKFVNYYTQSEIEEAINNPVIIHFTSFLYGKPMSIKCTHPYASYFRRQLENAPFDYKFLNEDIDIWKKIRRFFLKNMPFKSYLWLESLLDIRRSKLL